MAGENDFAKDRVALATYHSLTMIAPASLPGLSVVIPHYGDPKPTLGLIDALMGQAYSGDLQIIVADDASPVPFCYDGESSLVQVVTRPSNGGFGSAVNSGAAVANLELLLILNSDVEFAAGFLADFVTQSSPWMPAVASPRVVGRGGEYQWVGRHFPTIAHQSAEWLTPLARLRSTKAMHKAVGHDTATDASTVTPTDWVVGACMLLPRDSFEQASGFDEGYFMNSEEIDLQRRLRAVGIPSIVVGSITLTHQGGGSSDPLRRRQWLVKSRERYAQKWGHPLALKAALSAATGVNLAWNTTRRLRGVDVDPLAVARTEKRLIWRKDQS